MKNIITFLASACLLASGFKPLEAQEIQAVNGYPQAEYHKASDEHRNYISMLEKQGCTVHTVTNTLLSMPHSRLVTLAETSLSYDVSRLPRSAREAQSEYKQQVLTSMSNSDLVRIIINRPTVILKKSALEAEYERNGVKVEWVPLENLIGGYGAAHCMTQVLSRRNK